MRKTDYRMRFSDWSSVVCSSDLAVRARAWRKGCVLLAGEAAHQIPPFMGQGLCSGIRDVANLSWKLAAILKGDAAPALLDTYQPERAPFGRASCRESKCP